MNPIYIEPSAVDALRHAVGCTTRRPIPVYPITAEGVTVYGTYWTGGERNTYRVVNLDSLAVQSLPQYDPQAFGGPIEGSAIHPPEGFAVCIITAPSDRLTIYAHPSNMAKMLPQPSATVSEDAALVVIASAVFKSAYRRDALARLGVTPARYDAGLQEAIKAGFITPAKAVTTTGRNFANSHPMRRRVS